MYLYSEEILTNVDGGVDIGIRTLILFIKSKLYNNLTEFNNFRKGSDATWFHEFLNANVLSKFSGIRRISYSPFFF